MLIISSNNHIFNWFWVMKSLAAASWPYDSFIDISQILEHVADGGFSVLYNWFSYKRSIKAQNTALIAFTICIYFGDRLEVSKHWMTITQCTLRRFLLEYFSRIDEKPQRFVGHHNISYQISTSTLTT